MIRKRGDQPGVPTAFVFSSPTPGSKCLDPHPLRTIMLSHKTAQFRGEYISNVLAQMMLLNTASRPGASLFGFVVVHSVVSDSLQPYKLQHTRLPCPSLSLRVCSNPPVESVMPSNRLVLCRPLLLLPSASVWVSLLHSGFPPDCE